LKVAFENLGVELALLGPGGRRLWTQARQSSEEVKSSVIDDPYFRTVLSWSQLQGDSGEEASMPVRASAAAG